MVLFVNPHMQELKVWGSFIHVLHRQASYDMPLLSKCLPYSLNDLSLSRILFRITQKHCSLRQSIDLIFQYFREWQHTRWNYGDIIKSGVQDRFWRIRQSISVGTVNSVSHTKLVFSITFLAFCLPRCT